MAGLPALGGRLKELRQKAGISQMKLAELIGFDPKHGYKYVLRLEKGLVPNPTLRTIAAFLEACGAAWQSVADVLPATGTVSAPTPSQSSIVNRQSEIPSPAPSAPQSKIGNRKSQIAVPPSPAPSPQSLAPSPSPPAPPRRKDSRPMREQLRSQRIEQRQLRTKRFWETVQQAEEATRKVLHSSRVPAGQQPAYRVFARQSCSTLDALESARPELAERELGKSADAASKQGLDRGILNQILAICIHTFRSQEPGQ
jgi:transcriptional regulator with XRE-family HTH domain